MTEYQNAYQVQGNRMTRMINIAIGVALVAVIVAGGILAYMHFRGGSNANSVLQRDLEKWQQMVDENPSNNLARANLGSVYLDMGDTDSAIRELTLALDQAPESFTYSDKLADAYVKKGDYQAAIGLFMQAADKLPAGEKYAPLYEAADASFAMGDREGAKDLIRKSLEDNDIIWNSHFLLGRILEDEGDKAGARDEYLKAAKYNSGDQSLQDAINRVSEPAPEPAPAT